MHPTKGDIAQLGERGVRNAEVGGSSPPISTTPRGEREGFRQNPSNLMYPHEVVIYDTQGNNAITTYLNLETVI